LSIVAVEQVVGKMLLDTKFRQLIASDMSQALASYDLTEAEREGFKNMDLQEFDHSVTGLDERVSKGIHLN
jgi:hypothetical protein